VPPPPTGRACGWGRDELVGEAAHPLVDLVADLADLVDRLAGGVVQLPVLIPLAGVDRAGVAAAHRDARIRGADDLVREPLCGLLGHVPGGVLPARRTR